VYMSTGMVPCCSNTPHDGILGRGLTCQLCYLRSSHTEQVHSCCPQGILKLFEAQAILVPVWSQEQVVLPCMRIPRPVAVPLHNGSKLHSGTSHDSSYYCTRKQKSAGKPGLSRSPSLVCQRRQRNRLHGCIPSHTDLASCYLNI